MVVLTKQIKAAFPDPPPMRKGGSGEYYSTSSHYGLAVAMKSQAFEVTDGFSKLEGVLSRSVKV